jgi:hypothetical protein
MMPTPKLNRREELYQYLIGALLFQNLEYATLPDHDYRRKQGMTYFSRSFAVGDLILTDGSLRRNHNPWCVGVCVEKYSDHEVVIRDIFSGQLCNYGNESFISAHNIPFRYLLNTKDHKLYKRFHRAIEAVDYWGFDFRICHAEPFDKGVTFNTRRKWESVETGAVHQIKHTMLSRDIRASLKKIITDRQALIDQSKLEKQQQESHTSAQL